MRKGEILSLKWENVDFKKGLIFIEDSKSGKSREVYMNGMVFETLKELPQNSEYVFFNPDTQNHITDVKKSFKTACKNAGVKDMRFHDLRHTAATKMVEAGVDLATVSKILGHSSIIMTMRYAHPGEKTMRAAAEKLGQIYEFAKDKTEVSPKSLNLKNSISHFIYN